MGMIEPAKTVSTGIEFSTASVYDTWDEAVGLMISNQGETGVLTPEEFKPDRVRYEEAESLGLLRLHTMRHDGELVGYALFLIANHLHYKDTKFATVDVLYVSPLHRGINAVSFMQWQDEQLKSDGVQVVFRQVSSKNDYSRTLERMGYAFCERSFIKRI